MAEPVTTPEEEQKRKADAIARAAGTAVKPPPVPGAPAAPKPKSVYDIQREQVAADKVADEKRRADAVERAYSNRGLGDSGIADAAARQESVAASRDASSRYNAIAGNESIQAAAAEEAEKARVFAAEEADKGRAFLGSENAADRAAGKEQFYAGLNQAKDLAVRGLDLQASAQALQEKGMTLENAQYYAGLAQAGRLADKGLSLQESAQELTRMGMNQQDAQYYAGLSQARDLAEKGLSLDQARVVLAEQGMSQEDARYYAGLAAQEKATDKQNVADIQKGIIVDLMTKIDPKDPNYANKIGALLSQFSGLEGVFTDGVPAKVTTPEQDKAAAEKAAIDNIRDMFASNSIR